jgi:hypothetical protein
MDSPPTGPLRLPASNGNGDQRHFWLAVFALVVYATIALVFAYHPPSLPGDQAGTVLQTLGSLVVMAWVWFFAKRAV